MRVAAFRVQNYRNVEDSGWVELDRVTFLVGRNESGKTTLLKALHKFELLDQLELELGELVAAAAEDAAKADMAEGGTAPRPEAPPRGKPFRGPLPAHLPRDGRRTVAEKVFLVRIARGPVQNLMARRKLM